MTASKVKPKAEPLDIGGHSVKPGERLRFDMPVAQLPTHTQLHIPVTVVHGRKPGPRLWISAAVHGDELNGVEIIRRVLEEIPETLNRGSVIAVPVVNVFGFIGQSRYLPDRRDLNRSFPGSLKGSLASRIAKLFMDEIVANSTHGIDLHTATSERTNLPQMRGNMDDPKVLAIAKAFGAPAMVNSPIRGGSLRASASRFGIPAVVFEGGEALRFNEDAIAMGVRGILRVMHELKMVARSPRQRTKPVLIEKTSWVRARYGGLARLDVAEGDIVEDGQRIGTVSDPFGADASDLRAPFRGLVIGRANNPVVYGGDPVVNIGKLRTPE